MRADNMLFLSNVWRSAESMFPDLMFVSGWRTIHTLLIPWQHNLLVHPCQNCKEMEGEEFVSVHRTGLARKRSRKYASSGE
jgi:hypothetical protein